MNKLAVAALAMFAASAAFAEDKHEVSDELAAQIEAKLAEMSCEMDPDDIEVEDDGGYELDDVYCADGQYDMQMDADLNVTGKRKE